MYRFIGVALAVSKLIIIDIFYAKCYTPINPINQPIMDGYVM